MDDDAGDPRGRLAVTLRAHRTAAGLTQRQLAVLAGVSLGTLEDLEQGRTRRPRREALSRLAAALRLSPAELEELTRAAGRRARPAGHPRAQRGTRVEVLGPLAVWRDGQPLALSPARFRAVLGLLALHAGTGLSRALLVDALWGQSPPPSAAAMIQAQASQVRRLLGNGQDPGTGPRLSWDGGSYRLNLTGISLDLAEFGELAGRARRAATGGDAAGACELYERALGLWRGQPLEDIDMLYEHPAITELARRRAAVVISYADAAADAGQQDRVASHLAALAAWEPLDERLHAGLMRNLAATGQQAAALRVYTEIARRLDAELGVRPGPELAAAHLEVLRQQVPPAAGRPAVAGGRAEAGRVVPRQLPADVRGFAGRAAELATLTRLLDQATELAGTVVISAIGGTAGWARPRLRCTGRTSWRAVSPTGRPGRTAAPRPRRAVLPGRCADNRPATVSPR